MFPSFQDIRAFDIKYSSNYQKYSFTQKLHGLKGSFQKIFFALAFKVDQQYFCFKCCHSFSSLNIMKTSHNLFIILPPAVSWGFINVGLFYYTALPTLDNNVILVYYHNYHFMSHRRFENQLRMELVKNTVDWTLVLETIPTEESSEDQAKRRCCEIP